ncbi:MAG: hypothetical protein K2I06_12990, partial [Ruminococcus sp.]|nr:hypothetical protein [Ruminococcus sp.]
IGSQSDLNYESRIKEVAKIEYKLNDGEDKEKYSDFVSVVLYTDESEVMQTLNINCERNGQSRFENEKFEWNYDLLSAETNGLTEIITTIAETTTTTTVTVNEPPTEAPATEPPPPPEPVQPVIAESDYVLNTSTMKAHYPNCRDVDKIDPENRLDYYGTVEDVQSMGYSACGHCHTW